MNRAMTDPFRLAFSHLPVSLPIFPLPNSVVMPGCQLPLNIFEPRYLNMIFDALATDRLIGMVQPDLTAPATDRVVVHRTGTAGRITSFRETADGRLLIVLTGICRFDLVEEVPTTRGYRRFVVDWSRFPVDYETHSRVEQERHRVYLLLRAYFRHRSLEVDWPLLEKLPLTTLVNWMIGQLPFAVAERQSLVEAVSLEERLEHLMRLLQFELAEPPAQGSATRH